MSDDLPPEDNVIHQQFRYGRTVGEPEVADRYCVWIDGQTVRMSAAELSIWMVLCRVEERLDKTLSACGVLSNQPPGGG